MEQTSSFQDLFNAALQDYENQTRTSLVDHPFAKRLESCHSVDSITDILQEQAQIFQTFRGDDGKLMKSLINSVNILYPLSISTAGIALVHPIIHLYPLSQMSLIFILQPTLPVNAIFAGIAILFAVSPFDDLVCLSA